MKIKTENDLIEVIFDVSTADESSQVEQGERLLKKIESIYQVDPSKIYKIMLDLTKPKLHIDASSLETIKIYQRIVELDQTFRLAVLGKSTFADQITEVAFDMIAHKKAGWFTERNTALRWLQVKPQDKPQGIGLV